MRTTMVTVKIRGGGRVTFDFVQLDVVLAEVAP
jgi:hypothetical protein